MESMAFSLSTLLMNLTLKRKSSLGLFGQIGNLSREGIDLMG
jgi:hypothetical protein